MSEPLAPTKELTSTEIDRLEWLIGTIEAKNLLYETLTATEDALYTALTELRNAERASREAFASFYAALPGGDAAQALPDTVTEPINRWIAARRAWDEQAARYLNKPSAPPMRTGPRVRASLPDSLRVPASAPARDLMALFFAPHLWRTDAVGETLTAARGNTSVRLELDEMMGFGAEEALKQIAKQGASVAQTFFSLLGLWQERNATATSHETYMTVYASDLLRYQGRRQTKSGGYHRDDILAKGREIYLLSRISLPLSATHTSDAGRREARVMSLGRLLSLESLEMAETVDRDADGKITHSSSVVRFRYHLGKTVHDWIGGDNPQYALLSGKLLTYHPIRQKYQILLGFSLACYDRLHRDDNCGERRLSLLALLDLASLKVPQKRIAEFFSTIEDALSELARDGVIPGLRLQKPDGWHEMLARRDTRAVIAGSSVTFPVRMMQIADSRQR